MFGSVTSVKPHHHHLDLDHTHTHFEYTHKDADYTNKCEDADMDLRCTIANSFAPVVAPPTRAEKQV